jgi:regulator of cell morphogenesis and NO signaling
MTQPDHSIDLELVCDAIVNRYHCALQDAFARIREAIAVLSARADSPELEMLRLTFDEVVEQIAHHMAKEEHLLFPAFAALSGAERAGGHRPAMAFATVLHPIRLMEAEHARIEMALDGLRALARAVTEPEGSSPVWRQCLADLLKLDAELREHHRAENEVLFPQALELERRLL